MLTAPEKLPVKMSFQSKPSYNVIQKGEWGHGMHLPFEGGQHQQLRSLNSLCLKHILSVLHLKTHHKQTRVMRHLPKINKNALKRTKFCDEPT